LNNIKVSIVVPVYNTEKYLRRCLDSLVGQSLKEIEVILVDDGSTDSSGKIADEYGLIYPDKIKVFHKENDGPSEARNFGLSYARGDYIGFVDSDDYVDTSMFEKLYLKAFEENSHITVCAYVNNDENTGKKIECQKGNMPDFNKNVFENPMLMRINTPYVCDKIFKRNFFEHEAAYFPKGLLFEDIAVVYPLLLKANKISKVDEALYYYTTNRRNSTTATFSKKRLDIIKTLSSMNDFFRKNDCFERFYEELVFLNIRHIYYRILEFFSYSNRKKQRAFLKASFGHLDKSFPDWKKHKLFFDLQFNTRHANILKSRPFWEAIILCPKSIMNFAKKLKSLLKALTS
jgi:glycosyltransferase involved in cell wall biosynthesis